MRPLLVVVGHELTQDSHQVLLVQHNEVVETLSPQGANHSLGTSVRTRRTNRRGDGVDTDAPSALAEVATVDYVAITQQMAWFLAPRRGLGDLPPHPGCRRNSTSGLRDACPLCWQGQRRSRGLASSSLPNHVRKTIVFRSLMPRARPRLGRGTRAARNAAT